MRRFEADYVSFDRERGTVRAECGERRVLRHALRVVGDDRERLEHERNALAPKRRRRGVSSLGHMKVEVRPVRVPRVADRTEDLSPVNHVPYPYTQAAGLEVPVECVPVRLTLSDPRSRST